MRGVTHRTGEAILLHVPGMLAKAGVVHKLIQIVALGAKSVGAASLAAERAQVGIRIEVRHQLARQRRLAELVPALQNVRKDGAMGAACPRPAEFAIVVAIVTVGAKYAGGHDASKRPAVEIQLVCPQT